MSVTPRVWFHRGRSILWVVVGVASFVWGFANSVMLVWIASLYANVVSDWGAAEAANNTEVLEAIAQLRKEVRAGACHCSEPVQRG